MSNATNLSKLANLLDDGTAGQVFVSEGGGNVAVGTLTTANVSEGVNLYFTDERVQTKLGSISGNVIPDTNVAYDLGSAAFAFKDLYLSGNTIRLGSLTLSDNGGALETTSVSNPGVSQAFATETYVDVQVAALVDSAPTTLDTLNELAAALGDDANFSTTIVAQLGTVSANTVTNSTNINTVQANVTALPDSAANDHTTYTTLSGLIDTVQANVTALPDSAANDHTTYTTLSGLIDTVQTNVASISSTTLLGDLSDVSNTAPGDGQALVWDNTNSEWKPDDVDVTSSDLDMGGNKVLFANMYATEGDLPNATTYHGMFAHVHANSAGYFAHAGSWVKLANYSDIPSVYTDSAVDTHLNTSTATSNQVLSWDGADYAWVAQSGGGGGSTVSVSDTAPSSPSNGDQWFNSADGSMYVYYADGSSNQWVSVSGPAGSSVSVGTSPPSGAANGDQWFDSSSATLYVYYADGSSSQWVGVSGPRGPAGPSGAAGVSTGKAIAMAIVFG